MAERTRRENCFNDVTKAKEHRPTDKPDWKLFSVVDPDGSVYFTWAGGGGVALSNVVYDLGWRSKQVESVSKEEVSSKVAMLSEKERQELIAELTSHSKKKVSA